MGNRMRVRARARKKIQHVHRLNFTKPHGLQFLARTHNSGTCTKLGDLIFKIIIMTPELVCGG